MQFKRMFCLEDWEGLRLLPPLSTSLSLRFARHGITSLPLSLSRLCQFF